MLPIRLILHPTDFSEQAGHALQMACALARDHGSRLVLLHVAAPRMALSGEAILMPGPEPSHATVRRQLNQLDVPPGVLAERRLEEGAEVDQILRVAEEVHADLIVIGTHGRTGLPRLLMGSVAEQVLRQAACPVLVVKAPFPVVETAATPAAALVNA